MKIGVDYNGPIVDIGNLQRILIKKRLGKRIPRNFNKNTLREKGLSESQIDWIYWYSHRRSLDPIIKEIPNAVYCLESLVNSGHQVIIISHGSPQSHIKRRLALMGLSGIIVISTNRKPKFGVIMDLGLDVYIDNKIKHIAPLVGKVKKLYLFSEKRRLDIDPSVIITRNWKRIYNEITRG